MLAMVTKIDIIQSNPYPYLPRENVPPASPLRYARCIIGLT